MSAQLLRRAELHRPSVSAPRTRQRRPGRCPVRYPAHHAALQDDPPTYISVTSVRRPPREVPPLTLDSKFCPLFVRRQRVGLRTSSDDDSANCCQQEVGRLIRCDIFDIWRRESDNLTRWSTRRWRRSAYFFFGRSSFGASAASSSTVQRSPLSIASAADHDWTRCTLPPWTRNVSPVNGQPAVAR
jgi:hypothetical protein